MLRRNIIRIKDAGQIPGGGIFHNQEIDTEDQNGYAYQGQGFDKAGFLEHGIRKGQRHQTEQTAQGVDDAYGLLLGEAQIDQLVMEMAAIRRKGALFVPRNR